MEAILQKKLDTLNSQLTQVESTSFKLQEQRIAILNQIQVTKEFLSELQVAMAEEKKKGKKKPIAPE